MSMMDLSKTYEKIARTIASDLQSFIGVHMVKTDFDFEAMKSAAARKNPNTGDGTLRIRSGNLFRSFSPNRKDAQNILEIESTREGMQLRYGSKIPYAAIHEFGGTAGRNGSAVIPARPYFYPAIAEWKAKKLDSTLSKAKQEIILGVKEWLANQQQSNQ